jgi:uncharacterized protein (DUF885 family)
MLSRRTLIASGGASLALAALPAHAAGSADMDAQTLLAGLADEMLADFPENATYLGIDKGARAGLKSRLTDRSPAGQQRLRRNAENRLARLKRVDLGALSPGTRVDVDVVRTAHETALAGYAFPFGDVVPLNNSVSYRNAPYVVAQNTGAFVEVPDFLDATHAIATDADRRAYLARLESYAAALDGETERLRADRGRGVVAPAFLLDKTLAQLRAARAEPIAQWGVVASLARRSSENTGGWSGRAQAIVRERVAPALDRQIAELTRHRARATVDAGVWKLPEGEAYYAWALAAGTTTRLTSDEVHARGLAELGELHGQMDVILRGLGLTTGSVGDRMTALGQDPRYLFPATDAGRAQILAYIDERIADIRTRLPRAFSTLVPGRLVVKRVPPSIENGAPNGYAGPGTMDGSVPGNYYINLRDTGIWPRYALPTLSYHEGIPGHIWQGEYSFKLPLVRSLLSFNAYSEGWALYAEQLADELGAYDGDPVGRLGYLQSIAFRACRLVVDTGLHAKRWTRAQAIAFFVERNGNSASQAQSEVDRYCAWPGQACGYKVGHSEINRLRLLTRQRLGGRYDQRRFNDAVVATGGVPMTVLERVIGTLA